MSHETESIYRTLGVREVINAAGNMTLLGGSRPAPGVLDAMERANRHFVDMEELLKRTGERISQMLGAEAALVTSGCAAALALGTAACLTGSDPMKIERLPDTTGMRDQVLIQNRQRYKYDRCLSIFGGKLREVGEENGTSRAQLESAIDDNTALVFYFAPGGGEGVLPLEEVLEVSHAAGVPVLVDAAAQVFPTERMRQYAACGADLVCFGAKYFGALNSTGILCGRKGLIEAAFLHSFVGYEVSPFKSVGRPLKVDRQEAVAVVFALQEWMRMDHGPRLAEHERKMNTMWEALQGIPHVTFERVVDDRSLSTGVRVTLNEAALGKTAGSVIEALRSGEPAVWLRGTGPSFHIAVTLLTDAELAVVSRSVREVLG